VKQISQNSSKVSSLVQIQVCLFVAFRQHKTLIGCLKTTLEEIRMVRTLI